MRGRLWLYNFRAVVLAERGKHPPDWKPKDAEWTEFMGKAMDEIGKKMNCHVIRKREEITEKALKGMTVSEQLEEFEKWRKNLLAISREYFNIDAVFVDRAEHDLHSGGPGYGPFVLPVAVAELENQYDPDKISYCLWKLLCVRAPVRALICYQQSTEKVRDLERRLEKVIWEGSLMKGTDGDLLVIIGNEDTEETLPDYFSAFEWRHDSLEKV